MSGGTRLENANPVIFQRSLERLLTASEADEDVHDPIDDREIFDIQFLTSSSLFLFLHLKETYRPVKSHCLQHCIYLIYVVIYKYKVTAVNKIKIKYLKLYKYVHLR